MKRLVKIVNKIVIRLAAVKLQWVTYYHKSLLKKCGKGLRIFGKVIIYGHDKIEMGERCRINEGVMIAGRGNIKIGNDVTFSPYVRVISAGYDLKLRVENSSSKVHEAKSVVIGDACWLSTGATILPGVKITGIGVVVAAGAVVTKDIVEDYVVVGGVPAVIIKRYNEERSNIDARRVKSV